MTGFTCSAPLYEYEHGGKTWLIEVPKIGVPSVTRADLMSSRN